MPSEVSLRFDYVRSALFLHLGSVDFQGRSSKDLRVLSHFHYVSLDPKFQLWIFKVTEGEMGKLEDEIDF